MVDCNPVATFIDKGHEPGEGENVGDEVPYREIIGSLMYLAIGMRSDIAYAVSVLSRVLDRPTSNDWSTAKRILRYLKGTADVGIVYHVDGSPGSLVTFSDADYVGDPASRRSTTGVICMLGGVVVSWLQKSVSLSTMEVDIIAASEATKEVVWLARMCNDITHGQTTPVLYIDNMSTVKLVKILLFTKEVSTLK